MNRTLPPCAPRALALLVASAFAFQAQANSGRVEFVSGSVSLKNAQGERPLARGSELRSGDTVVTTGNGRAQVRFSDGAYVSLQPETEFSIEQYQFNGQADGSERGLFGLVRGTMRTITGLVGRVNRDRYALRTPNATIGIRGTGGVISTGPEGTTVRGTSGVWIIGTDGGTRFVPAGRTVSASGDGKSPPKDTTEGGSDSGGTGSSGKSGSSDPSTSPAENRNSTGQTQSVSAVTVKTGVVVYSLVGGNTSFALSNPQAVNTSTSTGSVVELVTNASGQLTDYKSTNTNQPGQTTTVAFSGTHAEGGTSGDVGWGRWSNGTLTNTFVYSGGTSVNSITVGSNGGLHYFYGSPATAMPTSGSFTYNMLGATSPTFKTEGFAPGTVTSAQLFGTFTPTGGTVGMSMALTANAMNLTMSTSATSFTGSSFNFTGNTLGGTCSSGCSTSVHGAFSGTGASNAGVGYAITMPGNTLGGVITFKK